MVSALRFKGDKKPSKKRKSTSSHATTSSTDGPSSSRPRLSSPSAAAPSSSSTSTESSTWTPATNTADLAASPITLIASSHFLASDLAGRVFASPTDGTTGSSGSVPEPTQISQVFEAKPIFGAEMTGTKGTFSIRSHGQRYLSSDKYGAMECGSEAIGEREVWKFEKVGEGWEVRGWKGVLGAVAREIEGDDSLEGEGRKKKKKVELRADVKSEELEVAGEEEEGDEDGKKRLERLEKMPAVTWMVCCQTRFKTRDEGEKEEGKAGKVVRERIGKRELEKLAGRELNEEEVRSLKKAKREGRLNEALLDVRAKSRRDKFAF